MNASGWIAAVTFGMVAMSDPWVSSVPRRPANGVAAGNPSRDGRSRVYPADHMAPVQAPAPPAHPVHYPESDGLPLSENTLQFEWIVTPKEGLASLFANRADAFVAGDLLWYYVEGDNQTRVAPDAMVVFGRPPGHRGSYKQWLEGGVCPQVIFEVLSPGNRFGEMLRKLRLYERLGVEEYYVLNPGDRDDPGRLETLEGWWQAQPGQPFAELECTDGWRSPRLGVTFESTRQGRLRLVRPDGRLFETFLELSQRAEREHQRVETERQRAEAAERQWAEALLARLWAAGIDPGELAG